MRGAVQRVFGGVRRYSSADARRPVGFIGLGNMGGHMARNLIAAGHDVLVYDSDPARLRGFTKTAPDLRTLARHCPRLITMLPSDEAVERVYLAPEGLLGAAASEAVFLDCSTVSPGVERAVAQHCSARHVTFLDAPVSGGVGGAEKATLTFLVGGPEAAVAANRDLLEAMGKRVFSCGPVGSGQIAKICNNMILGVSMAALAEALHLGAQLGLDPKILSAVINTSSGRSWASELYNPVPGVMADAPASRGYQGGFMARLMLKDMLLAAGEAHQVGAATPVGDAARRLYQRMAETGVGLADKDFSAVYELLKSLSADRATADCPGDSTVVDGAPRR